MKKKDSQEQTGAEKDLVTITRKIQLLVMGETKEERKEVYDLLRDWEHKTFRAANTIVNHQYFTHHAVYKIKEAEGMDKAAAAREVMKSLYDTSIQNSSYQLITKEFPMLPSAVKSSLNAKVIQKFNSDLKEVLRGQRSLATYRYGMPIPFNKSDSITIKKEEGGDGEKPYYAFHFVKGLVFKMNFGKDKSNNKAVVDYVMAGDYKFCDSEIQFKDGKLFLLMTIRFKRAETSLDYGKTIALNLGLNSPIFCSTSDGKSFKIGSRDEFLNTRAQLNKRRENLNSEVKMAKGGHGRKRKLKAMDRFKELEHNFATTYNHKLSKYLINYCLQHRIGNIRMEELFGCGENLKKSKVKTDIQEEEMENKKAKKMVVLVLRNWSYYQLQSFIEYKAKMYRINVEKVKPFHFTQMCNCCRNISETAVDLQNRVYRCENEDCEKYDTSVDIDLNNSLNMLHYEKPVEVEV